MTLERTAAKKANSHFSVRFQCPNQHATEWNYKTLLENSYDIKNPETLFHTVISIFTYISGLVGQYRKFTIYLIIYGLYFLMLCMDSGAQSSENKSFQYAVVLTFSAFFAFLLLFILKISLCFSCIQAIYFLFNAA